MLHAWGQPVVEVVVVGSGAGCGVLPKGKEEGGVAAAQVVPSENVQ